MNIQQFLKDTDKEFDEKFIDRVSIEVGRPIFCNRECAPKVKEIFHSRLRALLEEVAVKIEKADIAEDKVGTFQDGYRCLREQVLALIRKEN